MPVQPRIRPCSERWWPGRRRIDRPHPFLGPTRPIGRGVARPKSTPSRQKPPNRRQRPAHRPISGHDPISSTRSSSAAASCSGRRRPGRDVSCTSGAGCGPCSSTTGCRTGKRCTRPSLSVIVAARCKSMTPPERTSRPSVRRAGSSGKPVATQPIRHRPGGNRFPRQSSNPLGSAPSRLYRQPQRVSGNGWVGEQKLSNQADFRYIFRPKESRTCRWAQFAGASRHSNKTEEEFVKCER